MLLPLLVRLARLLLLLLALSAPAQAAQPAADPAAVPDDPPPGACDMPPDFTARAEALPHTAAALRAKRLEILAVGSATMLGAGAGEEGSIPAETASRLRAAQPGVDVRLTLDTRRGATASDMLAILRVELARKPYQLVLWQTGTVEAARRLPVAEFERVLREGSRLVRASGGDLVLIDPQFSRLLESHADPAPYETVFVAVARDPEVTLFSRYALIQHWIESRQLDLEHAARKDRRRDMALLHVCVARGLAQTILAGTRTDTP